MKYPECKDCYFHNREPAICDECEDASNYEPDEESLGVAIPVDLLKEAA